MRTARRDAKCRTVIKNKSGFPVKLEIRARCPEDEIGINSVIACTIARKI